MFKLNFSWLGDILNFSSLKTTESFDPSLLRAELYSIEQLKRHAIKLAKQHVINPSNSKDKLLDRLASNERVIANAYKLISETNSNIENNTQNLSPAENWLLDNYYIVQQQFILARRHLPRGYSRQLPKILGGVSDGYPRIYDLALNLISHMDGRVDKDNTLQFIEAYQTLEPLMIGELWAFPIMLQLALIENLRRVSIRIVSRRKEQETATHWADRMLASADKEPKQIIQILAKLAEADIPLTAAFVEEFYTRLQDQGAAIAFVQTWVDQQLLLQNITATQLLESASRAAATNQISIANSIVSLRTIAAIDWENFVETLSIIELNLIQDPSAQYRLQDSSTRDQYRHSIEDIARLCAKKHPIAYANHSARFEISTVKAALELASSAKSKLGAEHHEAHVGYYLIDQGISALKLTLNCHSPFSVKVKSLFKQFGLGFYISSILMLTIIFTVPISLVLKQSNLNVWLELFFYVLTSFSFLGLSVGIVNLFVTQIFPPHSLPRLDFSQGIPERFRTIVVVPTLIGSVEEIDELLEALEIRYLGNQDANLFFSLLTDFRDAFEQKLVGENELLAHASSGIEALNKKYLTDDNKSFFYLFHRQREWNEIEKLWMGKERKRGKLEQFNSLLRDSKSGNDDMSGFWEIVGDLSLLKTFKYVITLDTDTQLPRDSARLLIGNMAHSLNRPIFDASKGRVTHGYAILQPRASISLESASHSYFTKLYAGETGIDPYTRETSDVYQDIFGEGSFVGKGIYDIEAFRQAIDSRLPDNLILSHDLLESGYARSGLVTDVELIEDYPISYLMDISRRHRWVRGDWQITNWLFAKVPSTDNKVQNPLSLLLKWKIFDNLRRSLVPITLSLLLVLSWIITANEGLAKISWLGLYTVLLIVFLLPVLDLVISLLYKSKETPWISHMITTLQTSSNAFVLAILQLIFLLYESIVNLDAIINSAGRRIFTKRGLMQWHSTAYAKRNASKSILDFYSEMWTAPVIAIVILVFIVISLFVHETVTSLWLSCTPILVLWILSPSIAWFISKPIGSNSDKLTENQVAFLHAHAKLTWEYFARFVRKEDNWLPPDNVQVYPSELIASRTSPTNMGLGLLSNLAAYDFGYITLTELFYLTQNTISSMEKLTRYNGHFYNWYDTRTLQVLNPLYVSSVDSGNLLGCLITLKAGFEEIKTSNNASTVDDLINRIDLLADMDFAFLYDESTDLLSIGFDAGERRRDPSCYDLLASEARLASFILIAKNQLPQKHWFSLGRLLSINKGESSLISWSGSMFEYLMPQLLMPTFENTLLDRTYKAVVKQQIRYGQQHNIPWGISESCYSLTDSAQIYQYRAFGVPGSGFKRGLADDLVIAPYATALALLVMPNEACKNLQLLADNGFVGEYGFYEAIDYTPNRLARGKKFALVQSFMAHHQGMSFLSFAHVLLNKPMQRRFISSPYIKATALLLQERVPKMGSTQPPNIADAKLNQSNEEAMALMRVYSTHNTIIPEVHLLSNGRYHVMMSNSGSGYSRWHDLSITRWREDATQDNWGSYIYIRDMDSQRYWSSTHQPTLRQADHYEAIFTQAKAEYRRRDQLIETHTEICVSPEDDVEIRRVKLTNLSNRVRHIEITSYAEVTLSPQNADLAHRAFSNLFVQSEILYDRQAIIFTRRPRTKNERVPWMFHLIAAPGSDSAESSYETDRSKFIGRGRTAARPVVFDTDEAILKTAGNIFGQVSSQITNQLFGKQGINNVNLVNQALSNTDGSVLDPIAAIRKTFKVATDNSTVLHIITGVASSREEALSLIDKYGDRHFAERAFEMAWFQSQEVLRMLNASETDAQMFGRLASSVIFSNLSRRISPSVIIRNTIGQSGLWRFGISGDLPIVLIQIGDASRINLIKQLLQAHSYWRMNGLMVDLVIINEDFSGYRAALQDAIIGMVNSGPEAQSIDKPGGVFIRRAEELSEEARVLLQTVARIVFAVNDDSLMGQLERRVPVDKAFDRTSDKLEPILELVKYPQPKLKDRKLIFNNGLGGFTSDGREYVITLQSGQSTPAPWSNVISSPYIGTVVSEAGSAYTWVENAHEFRLTAWNNDPLSDTSGETYYIRDDETGAFWSPTPLPNCKQVQESSNYVCRHGFGYSTFEHQEFGIYSELTTYVAMDAPVKFVVLKLRNETTQTRQLSVMGFLELVMGEWRHTNLMHIVTEQDGDTGAILARNPYSREHADSMLFAHVSEKNNSITGDRVEFIGRNNSMSNPAAMRRKRLSGKVGGGLDPCAALQTQITLLENQELELVFIFGTAKNLDEAHNFIKRMGGVGGAGQVLDSVHEYWNHTLGAVQIETPDAALNILANGWLLYQTISSRLWGRSGYYQSGGAYGFRDQLQDSMALIHATPWLAREQIIRCAERQFPQGDVQHWWHPPNGQGVRTHFSDDYLWLVYATCRYVTATGDMAILDQQIHFLEGRDLSPAEEAYYDLPQRSNESASLYEHCVRAIKNGLKFGPHQLPVMGCGDWNDGMNLVGKDGKGESVWLAWFLLENLNSFSALAIIKKDNVFADLCVTQAKLLKDNIEKNAWDGEWYRRAYFDDGTPLGSKENAECQIDSISQSWAVISKSGDATRALQAMESVNSRLVKRDAQLIKLLDPPFDRSNLEPGYIKGYVPGVRENGGQYTHAAIWTTMAFAMQGKNELAWELYQMLNPIHHATTPTQMNIYKVEPYVMSADVYAAAPHIGRGGWTWYTGAAGWMYRLTLETLLGITLENNQLRISPCVPNHWQNYKIHYRYQDTVYHISINCKNNYAVKKDKFISLTNDHRDHYEQIDFD